jgi:hypothetical protein
MNKVLIHEPISKSTSQIQLSKYEILLVGGTSDEEYFTDFEM